MVRGLRPVGATFAVAIAVITGCGPGALAQIPAGEIVHFFSEQPEIPCGL